MNPALIPRFTAPALCAESDSPDDWFPPAGGGGVQIGATAKAVCRQCPALEECRTYALANPDLSGIWAGLSSKDREALRRDLPTVRRERTQCTNGHRYTAANTQMTSRGRRCRTCHNHTSNRERVTA